MADRPRDRVKREPLTSSAQILRGVPREQYALQYKTWQDELWAYRQTVGEFSSVINWFAAGFSRMHLHAAVWKPNAVEPEIIETGPAADLVQGLVVNAKGGESQFLRKWALHLAIPGVGYFFAEDTSDGRTFDVKSADVIKRSGKEFADRNDPNGRKLNTFDLRIAPSEWRTLDPNDSLVGRIFDPDPRYDYLPTSITQATLPTLREIDLINRAIIATLLSRVAFNGILFIPEEVTFPVNPQFKDAPDPFIAELLHYASRGIKDPGSPGAAIPFPLRVNSAFIEKFKHLILSTGLDPKIIEARQSAVTRLSEQLPAPPEAMTGISDMNHWNASSQSEENVKLYFSPPMETLVGGLTEVFLHPMLKAENSPITDKNGNKYVVWYDASDLTTQPDNSENATNARDRVVIKDEAYRRTIGMDEQDKPSDEEKRLQILTNLAMNGTPVPNSYLLLFPKDKAAIDEMAPKEAPEGSSSSAVGPSEEEESAGKTKPKEKP